MAAMTTIAMPTIFVEGEITTPAIHVVNEVHLLDIDVDANEKSTVENEPEALEAPELFSNLPERSVGGPNYVDTGRTELLKKDTYGLNTVESGPQGQRDAKIKKEKTRKDTQVTRDDLDDADFPIYVLL